MQKSQRKEKPLLYTLLIMALVLNSTMAFFLLANRDRLISQPAKTVAEPGVSSLSSRPSEMEKKKAISGAVSRPAGTQGRRPERRLGAAKSVAVANAPVKKEGSERKNKIVFFLSPRLYRLTRDTILVTRKDRTRIIIPKGTVVRVAAFADGDRALVVSRRGKPDGYVPRGARLSHPLLFALRPGGEASALKRTCPLEWLADRTEDPSHWVRRIFTSAEPAR